LILHELEKHAIDEGYRQVILETGTKQTEAISLYKTAGYNQIENYGQYKEMDNSICMLKMFGNQ